MKKAIGLTGGLALTAIALAAGGWVGNGHGEVSTAAGDAYLDIRAESRGATNKAVGSARFVIVDENDHPVVGIDLPRADGQFNTAQHDVVLQGPGGIRDAHGSRRVPVKIMAHDGGPNAADHVRVQAGDRTWEGDLSEGNVYVGPRR